MQEQQAKQADHSPLQGHTLTLNSLFWPMPSAVAPAHLTLSCWTRHQAGPAVQGPHLWSSTATLQPSLSRLSARLSVRRSTFTDLDWMSKPLARLKIPFRGADVPAQSERGQCLQTLSPGG